MLEQECFQITDPRRIRELIADNPWATLVSATAEGLQISHLPIVLADGPRPAVIGHLPRTDGAVHGLGEHEVALIIQGPHGYLSPSWYQETPHVPTWNFVVAHLYGRPQLLDGPATFQVLSDTVDHLEARLPSPWKLEHVASYADRIAAATVGFRLEPRRIVAKAKLSQDESADLVSRSVKMLRAEHPYQQPDLAEAMQRSLDERRCS